MPDPQLIGLFDRDVFLKLACCDLWDDLLVATGITRPFRLASCTVKASVKVVDRRITAEAARSAIRERLNTMVAAVPVIDDALAVRAMTTATYRQITDPVMDGIDGGEALLIGMSQLMSDPYVLISGDKRFIAALRKQFPAIYADLHGRILSFERCLVAICDAALRLALGSGIDIDDAFFLHALRSFDPMN